MTNPWQKRRRKSGWSGGYVEWVKDDIVHISVVFSWQVDKAVKRARQLEQEGHQVYVGGPTIDYDSSLVDERWIPTHKVNALPHHNPLATFTTRGCIRKCKFCIVPKIEGYIKPLSDEEWEPKPIICDNNLLAAKRKHFDHVIERLIESGVEDIDFNQGLDARLLKPYHAEQLVRLHRLKQLKMVRLAWDDTDYEKQFMEGYEALRHAGMPKSKIQVYVLIGFNDTPKDALDRLETIWHGLKVLPNPMRYQPIDAKKKNGYVHPNWTEGELKRYMRYWANLRHLSGIPFEEFDNMYRGTI